MSTDVNDSTAKTSGHSTGSRLAGLLAEFTTVDDLLIAAREVRDAGYTRWDTLTPFPVHGIDRAMGLRRTVLPWLVFAGGVAGCIGGILMQWWMNAVDYPFVVGGKPLFSLPAQIPIAFETTILLAAIVAFVAMLGLNKLPQHYHPLLKTPRFSRVTNDRFYVYIESSDPRFDSQRTRRLLQSLRSEAIVEVED